MSIFEKIKWIAAVLLIFGIVLATNLIDRKNFNSLKESVETIYEDRLIAKDLIFEISILVNQIQEQYLIKDSAALISNLPEFNKAINEYITRYEQTKITDEERRVLERLKQDLTLMGQLSPSASSEALATITVVEEDLYQLSKVQLKEGRKEMALSQSKMNTIDLFTQIEIIFLVLMAIAVQIIVLYTPKKKEF